MSHLAFKTMSVKILSTDLGKPLVIPAGNLLKNHAKDLILLLKLVDLPLGVNIQPQYHLVT